MTYASDAPVIGSDIAIGNGVHHENTVYGVREWNFHVELPDPAGSLNDADFSNAFPGHTAEWCMGICLVDFAQQRIAMLRLSNGQGLWVWLAFGLNSEDNGVPSFEQIGLPVQTVYDRSPGQPVSDDILTWAPTEMEQHVVSLVASN